MRRPRRLLAFAIAAAVLAITVPVAFAAQIITLSGATASFPLLEQLTAKYATLQHNKIRFSVSQGGASVGIADVGAGKVDIGDSSRGPQAGDPPNLYFYPIAKYFVCVVTNKSNPIANLTESQVQQIFEGKVRNWSQVSGSSLSTTIDVQSRTSVAGVLTTFQNTLLGGGKVASPPATAWASEGLEQQAVEKDPNAIGFLSDYFAVNNKLNAVAYNGTACSVANAVNETYPGWSFFYEVTKGPKSGTEGKFINWIQTSKPAKKIIETNWIPLTITKPVSG
ncbi:MAG TPA: substrate-binding domain-containing protein [Solirubrobacteraceae bacterium]|nr:substrate-binding domain-containing protein [Solirubrobacteraceae bacterium]